MTVRILSRVALSLVVGLALTSCDRAIGAPSEPGWVVSAAATPTGSIGPLSAPSPTPTPGPTADPTVVPIIPPTMTDGVCSDGWYDGTMLAWGYVDDLLAARSIVPERHDRIEVGASIIDELAHWPPGEPTRTSLAQWFTLERVAEAAHDSGDVTLEIATLRTAESILDQALSAWKELTSAVDAPCYRDNGGSAAGG